MDNIQIGEDLLPSSGKSKYYYLKIVTVIIIFAILGFNIFTNLGYLTDEAAKLVKPVTTFFVGLTAKTAKKVIKNSTDGTKEIADRTAPDRTGIASNLFEQSMPEGLLKSYQDRMGADVSEAQKKARAESDVYTRREENRGELESGIAAQRAFQQRQLDPKKLQNDRLMANLIGGGQRGLLGAAMGGQQADAQVATFEGNQIKEVNRLTNEKIARDIDTSKIVETISLTSFTVILC